MTDRVRRALKLESDSIRNRSNRPQQLCVHHRKVERQIYGSPVARVLERFFNFLSAMTSEDTMYKYRISTGKADMKRVFSNLSGRLTARVDPHPNPFKTLTDT